MTSEEMTMIELTETQAKVLDAPQQPPVVIDPRNQQKYLLIRREVYEQVKAALQSVGRNWDNPEDDDLIRKDA
jgi:hypothetical protein